MIAVTTPPAITPTTPVTPNPTNRTTSRDSAERDSGNPSPDVTHSGSGRASRSPGGLQGSEGSMEFDSLSEMVYAGLYFFVEFLSRGQVLAHSEVAGVATVLEMTLLLQSSSVQMKSSSANPNKIVVCC